MRYTTISKEEEKLMLKEINVETIDVFFKEILKLKKSEIKLHNHKCEIEVENTLKSISEKNLSVSKSHCFLGAGRYNHHVPYAVKNIMQRSEFLTPYTPYQPEFSQGTLKAMFEFQTTICKITGMDVATSSVYDGATSLVDAIKVSQSVNNKKFAAIANTIHPHYLEVIKTYEYETISIKESTKENTSCIVAQYPDFHGNIPDIKSLKSIADETSSLLIIVINEIIALGLLPAPIEADIVCGDASSIGISNNFGGPYLGIFTCKEKYMRKIPGKLSGKTKDLLNNEAYTLTLCAREQHIRREKAMSNICTSQSNCATAFTIHAMLLGEEGFKKLALINHEKACVLAESLEKINGISVINSSFFNEFAIEVPTTNAKLIIRKFAKKNILAGYPISNNKILLAATELTTNNGIKALCKALQNKFN